MVSILLIVVVVIAVVLFIVYAAGVEKSRKEEEGGGPRIHYYSEAVANKAKDMEKLESIIASDGEKFTNQMIQKKLNIPAPTVRKYLNELERQGKIRQVGESGDLIYYKRF